MMSYCEVSAGHPVHGPFHDKEHGFPVRRDDRLFERLILEINQAGLSWLTVLKKRDHFRRAYDRFDIDAVAAYGARERRRLLADAGIIRNRLKVEAAIENAKTLQRIRDERGSFAAWIDAHHPRPREEWVKLFRSTFRFTGGEIVHEFLMGAGWLPGAHERRCPVYRTVAKLRPPWMRASRPGR